jgi:hypothetical protein
MHIKGLECATFNVYYIPKLTYCYSLNNTKQEIKLKNN